MPVVTCSASTARANIIQQHAQTWVPGLRREYRQVGNVMDDPGSTQVRPKDTLHSQPLVTPQQHVGPSNADAAQAGTGLTGSTCMHRDGAGREPA